MCMGESDLAAGGGHAVAHGPARGVRHLPDPVPNDPLVPARPLPVPATGPGGQLPHVSTVWSVPHGRALAAPAGFSEFDGESELIVLMFFDAVVVKFLRG